MGVSSAAPRSRERSTIHRSTRRFSPKPGHRNPPWSSLWNQLTRKIFGGSVSRLPMESQWFQ